MKVIMFKGRNRLEAKKKAFNYWLANKDNFNVSMKEFLQRCTMASDGKVIFYKE